MKLSGQTPLAKLPHLSDPDRTLLQSLWIESVEELISLAAVLDENQYESVLHLDRAKVQASRESIETLLSAERRLALSSGCVHHGLGCALPPELLAPLQAVQPLSSPARKAPLAFSKPLPAAVRLMDHLHPVKDQGNRGTCVAFSSVALREFIENRSVHLSEQFLYWACKELDGHPGPGTWLHTAMAALATYGVCTDESWPYNISPVPGSEGQGPPPPGALEEAKFFSLPNCRPIEPRLIEHHKLILAGDDGMPGMPVVIAVPVYRECFYTPEAQRTGKIILPLPGFTLEGGHAMCAVGYVDDLQVPGGGYFIVRNSWGEAWASENPEAPGHALVPYEFISRYCLDGFSGPISTITLEGGLASAFGRETQTCGFCSKPFITTLDRVGRCTEPGCGETICNTCWTIHRTHRCRNHQKA